MPIIKALPGTSGPANVHVITSVEIFSTPGGLRWVGKYRSSESGGATPTAFGTLTDVPFAQTAGNPVEAFEAAAVAQVGSLFHGGEVVPAGQGALWMEQQIAWARVKRSRDAYLDSGVQTPYGMFDSDLVSIVNVLGATAALPEGATTPWILKDSSTVTLTRSQVSEVGALLAAFRSAGYTHGSALRAQIDSEQQTVEAVRAIAWTPPA